MTTDDRTRTRSEVGTVDESTIEVHGEVHGLGSFTLSIGGRPVERWRAGKTRNLLQFLLLRQGKVVPKESLCDALWPDAPRSANTRSSLKVAVHTLRRILTEQARSAGLANRPPLRLVTCAEGYVLRVHRLRIDFEVFDELIDRGHRAELNGVADEATQCYREAVELYDGDFLFGLDAEWACMHREWLRGRYLFALQHLSNADLVAGDYLSVMRWCRCMIEVEPFHEEAYCALMVAHARLGQLSQVRRWYQMCADRLHGELQTAPDPVTEQVYTQAIQGNLVPRQARPIARPARSDAVHRLHQRPRAHGDPGPLDVGQAGRAGIGAVRDRPAR
jgi:DNA-binding SARP family transcriptional activator